MSKPPDSVGVKRSGLGAEIYEVANPELVRALEWAAMCLSLALHYLEQGLFELAGHWLRVEAATWLAMAKLHPPTVLVS